MSEEQFETLIQISGCCCMRTCNKAVGGRCWVTKCPFLTTSIIPYLSCLTPLCAPNKRSFLTWALNLHRHDYILFNIINAYDCYNQDFASCIILTYYDFTKRVQVVRGYSCSSPSGPERIWASTIICNFPVMYIHADPIKGYNYMRAVTDTAAIDWATTVRHYLKLAAII